MSFFYLYSIYIVNVVSNNVYTILVEKNEASKIKMEKTNEKGRIKKKTRATKKNLSNIAVVC